MTLAREIGRIAPYRVGLCMASVCAELDATKEEVEQELNASHPTGISSRWQISEDTFRTGESNPCPCNLEPEDRRHWLLEC